jgi:hypothetical protein
VTCAYRKPQKRRPLHVIKLSCETTKDRIYVTHSFHNVLSWDAGDDSGAVRKIHVHLEIYTDLALFGDDSLHLCCRGILESELTADTLKERQVSYTAPTLGRVEVATQ